MGFAVDPLEVPGVIGAQTKSHLLIFLLGPGQFHAPTLFPPSIRTGQLCVGEMVCPWGRGRHCLEMGFSVPLPPLPNPGSSL